MTLPRQILPGRSYLITRRCTQRQFLLRPSRLTNQNVEYCLALAAERTGVILHAVSVMSNHWHGVVTDPYARLPEFLAIFHKLSVKSQNASLGRWENFWSSDRTQPGSAGIRSRCTRQDGLRPRQSDSRGPRQIARRMARRDFASIRRATRGRDAGRIFDVDGGLPESVALEFQRPRIFCELSDSELQARLAHQVAKLVKRAREDMALRGLPFVVRNAVLRQSFSAVPKTPAPRRNPNLRIAAKSTPARIDAVRRMLEFVRSHRAAWNEWRDGRRELLFPCGTYALRIYARVACAQAVPA